MSLCCLLNASRKGVQAARIRAQYRVPPTACSSARNLQIGGIFVSTNLNLLSFKVNRDRDLSPVCVCSTRVLSSKANPDDRIK